MRLLLYGGTFDPPHNGHLNNLRAAAARVRPDRVVAMPAGRSPFKQSTAAPGSARVEMCACFRALEAEGAVPALCVSGWEVEQAALGRRNYTVLTLEMLARTYPEAELYMAMGSDMLLSFDSWLRWQEICWRTPTRRAGWTSSSRRRCLPCATAACGRRSRRRSWS